MNKKTNLELSLENKAEITVWPFSFRYATHSGVNLKIQFTLI